MDADRTRRESFRTCFPDCGDSCREPYHEFRGVDGGALQRCCQFVFRGAAGFFPGARRISSGGRWPVEQKEYARGCRAGLGGGNGRGASSVEVL